jgi:hypothetical protein
MKNRRDQIALWLSVPSSIGIAMWLPALVDRQLFAAHIVREIWSVFCISGSIGAIVCMCLFSRAPKSLAIIYSLLINGFWLVFNVFGCLFWISFDGPR